jgi:hypothetical protein
MVLSARLAHNCGRPGGCQVSRAVSHIYGLTMKRWCFKGALTFVSPFEKCNSIEGQAERADLRAKKGARSPESGEGMCDCQGEQAGTRLISMDERGLYSLC